MTIGRGPVARAVVDAAAVRAGDRALDVGCGPGAAVRESIRAGATGVGIDPSGVMLAVARRITRRRRVDGAEFLEGTAEALPLPDGSATVAWSISSAHHWADPAAGLAELRRVLAPSGRLVVAERLTTPGARGHAAHGFTIQQAEAFATTARAAGFDDVRVDERHVGRRRLVMISAVRPAR
jgi:ubiquinone/menaquinone biosynthesis C-methylase UbiE